MDPILRPTKKGILIGGIIALALAAWYTHEQRSAEQDADIVATENLRRSVELGLAYRNLADPSWPKKLAAGESIRFSKVQTYEVQTLWLPAKKILFVGNTIDIALTGSGRYKLVLEYGSLDRPYKFHGIKLRLELVCEREAIASVIAGTKNSNNIGLSSNTAVAAQIFGIESLVSTPSDEGAEHTITGQGICIEAMFLQR